jgi:hypothetical protein
MRGKRTAPTFHVGQQVVCIDAKPDRLIGAKPLTRGKVYTIRAIEQGPGWRHPGWGIHLEGIWIFYPDEGVEWAFHPRRFRPVVQRPTNIEIFKQMLAAVPANLDQ